MAKILVHVTHSPESPTRAALGFLVAKAALDEGHTASLFLAGDAVQLIRDPILDTLAGVGTGRLREHFDALVAGGARFYLSGMSAKSPRRLESRPRRQAGRIRDAERAGQAVARTRSDVQLLADARRHQAPRRSWQSIR
jgi:predicted peroxiredoxin